MGQPLQLVLHPRRRCKPRQLISDRRQNKIVVAFTKRSAHCTSKRHTVHTYYIYIMIIIIAHAKLLLLWWLFNRQTKERLVYTRDYTNIHRSKRGNPRLRLLLYTLRPLTRYTYIYKSMNTRTHTYCTVHAYTTLHAHNNTFVRASTTLSAAEISAKRHDSSEWVIIIRPADTVQPGHCPTPWRPSTRTKHYIHYNIII